MPDGMGVSRESTIEPAQVIAPKAFRRLRVMVVPVVAAIVSPPARMRFLMARQSRAGFCAFSNAATPVTCGVAMDVPLRKL